MHFAFTEDQHALRDSVRALLGDLCPPPVLRIAWASEDGRVPGLWQAIGDLGLLGMSVSDRSGGLALPVLDVLLVLEELGYAAVPEPVVETAFVAAPAIEAVGSAEARGVIAEIVEAGASVTVSTDAAPFAPWASSARYALIIRGAELTLCAADRVQWRHGQSVDGARHPSAVAGWSGAVFSVSDPIVAAAARRRGTLAASAALLGLSRRMLAMAVEYAKVREQFDRPIGAFQAVQHRLADAAIATEFARPLVVRAAWSIDTDDPDGELHVAMAKMMASDAGTTAAKAALQVHGAIGYSYECDLHLYMKRAWGLAAAFGDAPTHRRAIADALLGPRAAQPPPTP